MMPMTLDEAVALVVTPLGWDRFHEGADGGWFRHTGLGLKAASTVREIDGVWWRHTSVTRYDGRMPRHLDVAFIKREFHGDGYAYGVHPPKAKYVDIHSRCLHVWGRLDGAPVLPEFSAEIAPGVRSI